MASAIQQVTENRFVIPEEIPANERTAFHGAAAAAAKAGKKSFNFAGKSHPVTMKKDTATKIADEKLPEKKKHKGDTATMNPKMDDGKTKGSEMEAKENGIAQANLTAPFEQAGLGEFFTALHECNRLVQF